MPRPPVEVKALSKMQLEVLYWLSVGKRAQDIGDIMGITKWAVYLHTYRILDALGTSNAAGAVGIALRKGIIQ
jgi:DNA-binding CsgD family transcriptional regulator